MRGSLVKIKRGIELAKKGEFEKASKAYNSIKGKIDDKDAFAILQKQIKEYEHTEKLKLKNRLKEHLNNALDKKDYSSAIVHYKKAKSVYEKIPDKRLHSLISDAHKKIVTEHNKTATSKLDEITAKINELIRLSYESLKSSDKGKAVSYYREIKDLKSSMPIGFAKQKKSLFAEILKLHKDIIASKGEIGDIINEINKIIEKIEVSLSKDQDAHEDYTKLMGLYTKLSPEYLENNIDVSKRIKTIGDRVTKNKLRLDRKIIDTIKDKVASVLRRVKGNREKYNELVTLYSKMPKSDERKKVKKTILKAYTEHILENDEEHLEEYGSDIDKKYKDLLKFVVDFHHSVENGLFEDLGGQVKQIRKIYDSLPVGLVRGDAKLVDDVKKISLETDLYSRTMKLRKLSSDKLKRELDMIYVDVKRLEKNSHDTPLFEYIKSICGQYSLDMMNFTEEKQFKKHIDESAKYEAEIEAEKKMLSNESDRYEKHWYNIFSWFKNDKIEEPSLPQAEILPNIPKPISVDEDDIVNTMSKRDLDKIEKARVISNKKLNTLASNLAVQEKKIDIELERKLKHETDAIDKALEKSMYSQMDRIKNMSNEELRNEERKLKMIEDARIASNKALNNKALNYANQETRYHDKLMKDAHFIEMARRKSLASEVNRVKNVSSQELGKIQRDLDKIENARIKSNSGFSSYASSLARQEEIADKRLATEESENNHLSKFIFDVENKPVVKPGVFNRPIASLMKRVEYNENVRKMMNQRILNKIENARVKSNRSLSSRASLIAKQEDFADLKLAKQEKEVIDRIEHVRQLSNARVRNVLSKIEKNYPAENDELLRLQKIESQINSELEKLPAVTWSDSDTHSIVSDMPDFSVEIDAKRTVSLPLDKVSSYRKRLEIVKRKIDEEVRGFS